MNMRGLLSFERAGDMEDPTYIQNLLDPSSHYSCYFSIGDPHKGPVERIGVVPPMLMAHSLVLRRVLDVSKSELKEKWDIPVTNTTSKTFRNLLRYAYGYNNIKNQSLPHSVELLALADRWVMKPMCQDLANHIATIINPVNVCLAMRDPICFRVKKVEDEIARLVKVNAMRVLSSPYLNLVCPAGMRYIVLLKSLRASDLDVWRAVVKWARAKVLKENLMTNTTLMDVYFHPNLIVPCRKYIKLCSLNMIDLVEEVLANHPDRQRNIEGISKCHFIPSISSRSLYICTESKNAHHLKHEEFEVKVVHNCDTWMPATYQSASTLIVTNNSDKNIELYSIVCKSKLTHIPLHGHDLIDPTNHALQLSNEMNYDISCDIRVISVSIEEDRRETEIIHFETDGSYGHDFQIILSTKEDRLQLRPKRQYSIEMEFTAPHPLWYYDLDKITPGQSSELEVGCGLIDTEFNLYGSHVKYLLYRTLPQE